MDTTLYWNYYSFLWSVHVLNRLVACVMDNVNMVEMTRKMTPKDASIVGKRLATATLIAAIGFAMGAGGAGVGYLLRLLSTWH